MAKRRTKVVTTRTSDRPHDDDSLLSRSAESLGRVIGSLQKQVQTTSSRLSKVAEDALGALPELPELPPPPALPVLPLTPRMASKRPRKASRTPKTRTPAAPRGKTRTRANVSTHAGRRKTAKKR